MNTCLIDTTVLCNLVPVPGLDQEREAVRAQLKRHVEDGVTRALPIATIIETGNHIARHPDGNVRRATAVKFVRLVKQVIEGQAALTPAHALEPAALYQWLDEFPQAATQGIGMGDLSIIEEWEAHRRKWPRSRGHRVFIWSLDQHLVSFDSSLRADH